MYTLIPRLKAHVPISDISAPTLWIRQIIKVLMLNNTSSVHSTCIDEFSAIRIESFIVYFSLELVKFDISTCAFKRGIRVYIHSFGYRIKVIFASGWLSIRKFQEKYLRDFCGNENFFSVAVAHQFASLWSNKNKWNRRYVFDLNVFTISLYR